MKFTSITSRRKPEIVLTVRGREDVCEEIFREAVRSMQKMNRRRERCGGRRIGYRVELISSSSS